MADKDVLVTRGFDDFRAGTFGNGGQNLYVSRAGVLQRIFHFDFNHDGYLDVVFANSQDHGENPPSYVYRDPLGTAERIEIPSDGAWSGVCADLNGDGYDDLVIAMLYDGVSHQRNARIFYGSEEGFSEKRMRLIPAPSSTSVAAGDFNGDGRMDLVFLCSIDGHCTVRMFYQTALSFEPDRFSDLEIEGDQLFAMDIDGDGFSDLVVRCEDGTTRVYWGGRSGIDPERYTTIPLPDDSQAVAVSSTKMNQYEEYTPDARPIPKAVKLYGRMHIFCPLTDRVLLVPVEPDREFGTPVVLHCGQALSIDVGDINSNGHKDLALACRDSENGAEYSWIYWGDVEGFSDRNRLSLPTSRACDVVLADLNGNGFRDIVLCQCHTYESFSHHSLIYPVTKDGVSQEPIRLLSEDARRVAVPQGPNDRCPPVVFINHFSRIKTGAMKSTIYFGGLDGFSPNRKRDLYAAGAVESLGCDINDDGWADIVFANASENAVSRDPGSFVYLGGPEGFSNQPDVILPTTRAHGVACGDINHDGHLDLVFGGFDNPELLIFYGGPDGPDTKHPQRIRLEHEGCVYKEPRWLFLVDLNQNGWLDLVVPISGGLESTRSFILWGGPGGFSMDRVQPLSVLGAVASEAADLTSNGYPDLILTGCRTDPARPHLSWVYIYWNGPEGISEDNRTMLPCEHGNGVTVADFNNDGLLDIFVCSYHDGLKRDIDSYLYWNRAGRGFSEKDRTCLLTHSASGCLAADFNEDGFIDLAIANHKVYGDHRGYSEIWWNGPDGFKKENTTRLPTFGPHGICQVPPCNILDRSSEEYYVSQPYKLPDGHWVTHIEWTAETPTKTWVKAQLRFSTDPQELENASWYDSDKVTLGNGFAEQAGFSRFVGGWVQYRLALGAVNGCGTPRVTEVRLAHQPIRSTVQQGNCVAKEATK